MIVFISDPHTLGHNPKARTDNAVEACFEKWRYVLDYCRWHCAALVVAGDFFDSPRNWEAMARMVALLKEYSDVEVYSVFGQHDTYLYSAATRNRTALGILEGSGLVKILGSEPVKISRPGLVAELYGASIREEVPEPWDTEGLKILVIHKDIGTLDRVFDQEYEYTDAKRFASNHQKYNFIHCGDIHRKFWQEEGRTTIFNTGPLIRKEATEYNINRHQPCFAELREDKELLWHEIPAPPGEDVLSREHLTRERSKAALEAEFKREAIEAEKYSEEAAEFYEVLMELISQKSPSQRAIEIIAKKIGEMK